VSERDDHEELDGLKVKTMINMIKDVTIDADGRQHEKKLLFLTNKGAYIYI
jgi:hypothetical protein